MLFPFRVVRDLPIAAKLGGATLGALVLLAAVSWFGLERLAALGALQDEAAAQAAAERQVRVSRLAVAELNTISAALPFGQTVSQVKAASERAEQQYAVAREALSHALEMAKEPDDRALLQRASASLDAMLSAVKRQGELRREMLNGRQKNLFQARAKFETALNTLAMEVAAGGTLRSGVDSVREGGAAAAGDANAPGVKEIADYRLEMSRVVSGAIMFMATANGSAANSVRDGAAAAEQALTALLDGAAADSVKADAKMVDTLGRGIARAALTLLDQTRRLEEMTAEEMEPASQAMRQTVDAVAAAWSARVTAASGRAAAGRAEAEATMTWFIGGAAVLMLLTGAMTTRLIAGPVARLTRAVRAIASGDTGTPVAGTDGRDEIGRMAEAVERLRGVMRQTFVQAQMIEELPIGVMTAGADGSHPIQYLNAEAKRLMSGLGGVVPEELKGQDLAVFERVSGRSLIVTDPDRLPHRALLTLGGETLELKISALHDQAGAFAGPMVVWHRLTAQVRLADQFERSVGAIAGAVGDAANGMRDAAAGMSQSAADAHHRTAAVTSASELAASHVAAAASGAEELAASVNEIGRQAAESARIAALAVTEAEATDRSVGGLSEAAGKIGAVVELIGDIAARTNLLALNATIEAARAGEAGKGFAVVASEVKTLATQTARATEGIAAQIASMRDATSAAAAALRSIGGTIQRMNEIAVAIAAAVEEQGAATQDIARAVQQAAMGTTDVNDNIAVVNDAVTDTGQRASAVLEAATALTGRAEELKAQVSLFLGEMQQAA